MVVVLAVVSPAALADGTPRIALSQPFWDFGTVHPTDQVQFELTISNTGDGELRLSRVFGCCGCTVTPLEKYEVAPGEQVTAKISFDVRLKSGKSQARVTIKSNDPQRPAVLFAVTGIVKRSVELTPAHGLRFNTLEPNKTQTQKIRLVNQEKEPMRLEMRPLKTGKFVAELKTLKEGRAYELTVTTRPPFERIPVEEKVYFTTGLEQEPRIEILVRAQVVDRVELYPMALYMPESPDLLRRVIVVRYFGDDASFRVTRAECGQPGMKLTVGEPEEARQVALDTAVPTRNVRILVDLAASVTVPAEGVKLTIFTNDPEFPEITMLVTSDVKVYQEARRFAEAHSQRRPVP
jgi:hypothetical protein